MLPLSWMPVLGMARYHVVLVRRRVVRLGGVHRLTPRGHRPPLPCQVVHDTVAWLVVNIDASVTNMDGTQAQSHPERPGKYNVLMRCDPPPSPGAAFRPCAPLPGTVPAGATELVPYSVSCEGLQNGVATAYVFAQAGGPALAAVAAGTARATLQVLRAVSPTVQSLAVPAHCPGACCLVSGVRVSREIA